MPAHKGSLGDWIRIASSVEPELAAVPRNQRRSVLERAAGLHGRKPSTIHRMIRAYRYVLSRAKTVGLELDRVAAPVVCVELLERMERRGTPVAVDLRRQVLSGGITFQELRGAEVASRVSLVARMRDSDTTWAAFAVELANHLFGARTSSFAFGADRDEYSQTARNLSVDWEVVSERQRMAIFLSPQCVFSEHRGRTVLEQLPRAVMATLFYDRVIYMPWDEEESRTAAGYLPTEDRCAVLLGRLEIVPLMGTARGRPNRKCLRA